MAAARTVRLMDDSNSMTEGRAYQVTDSLRRSRQGIGDNINVQGGKAKQEALAPSYLRELTLWTMTAS